MACGRDALLGCTMQATFALVLGLTFMGGISLLVLVLWHVRRRRLMFISSLS